MKLNKTLAVALHRAMWTDMQTELGDNPTPNQRSEFKAAWILKYFPKEKEYIMHNCFLCDYAFKGDTHSCSACPIRWPGGHCTGSNFSYATAPISDILALPEKGKYVSDETATVRTCYGYREELLSKASGLPGSSPIDDHVKAIQKKAREEGYETAKEYLAECSGLSQDELVFDHIKAIKEKAVEEKAEDVIYDFLYRCEKYPDIPINERLKKRLRAIQEKAVEEYFEKTPGAKLASMDVDQAFKQYADEQKAPIFHALAEVFDELSEASGLPKGKWCISDHVKAIQERAKKQMDPYVKSSTLLLDTLNKYKDYLSDESGLDRNRPVSDHINEIYDDAFSDGRDYERERIMNKIGEMLNDQSAGETKNS